LKAIHKFFSLSYLIDQTICYLTLTEKTYPKRLAFLFLEEIAKDFVAELMDEHGDEYAESAYVSTIKFIYICLQ